MRAPIKLDLEKETRRCGNCRYGTRIRLRFDEADLQRLKTAAQHILETSQIANDDAVTIVAIHEKLADKKIYCGKERAWVDLLELACAFWLPQGRSAPRAKPTTESIPKAMCPQCRSVKLKPRR
ncbi:hypothetical protein G4O51_13005, partial [Candidatus Bathyarchaeota archaeon A05DMB-2]|nr:hypothetical protein [Candidatus Bathyarchaeota archaeon A05DMB-2]